MRKSKGLRLKDLAAVDAQRRAQEKAAAEMSTEEFVARFEAVTGKPAEPSMVELFEASRGLPTDPEEIALAVRDFFGGPIPTKEEMERRKEELQREIRAQLPPSYFLEEGEEPSE